MILSIIKGARVLMSTDGSKQLYIDVGNECIPVRTGSALDATDKNDGSTSGG